jgi:hypothetical protein
MGRNNYDDAHAAAIADDVAKIIHKAKNALRKEFIREYPALKDDDRAMENYVDENLQEYLDYERKNK